MAPPPIPAKTFDLQSVFLTLGGRRITGFGADAAIELVPQGPPMEGAIGADGQTVYSRTNDFRGLLRITVMETSLAYQILSGLLQAQEAEGAIARLAVQIRDTISGDLFSDEYGVFLTRPTITKNKRASERVFEVECPNIFNGAKYGPDISI